MVNSFKESSYISGVSCWYRTNHNQTLWHAWNDPCCKFGCTLPTSSLGCRWRLGLRRALRSIKVFYRNCFWSPRSRTFYKRWAKSQNHLLIFRFQGSEPQQKRKKKQEEHISLICSLLKLITPLIKFQTCKITFFHNMLFSLQLWDIRQTHASETDIIQLIWKKID